MTVSRGASWEGSSRRERKVRLGGAVTVMQGCRTRAVRQERRGGQRAPGGAVSAQEGEKDRGKGGERVGRGLTRWAGLATGRGGVAKQVYGGVGVQNRQGKGRGRLPTAEKGLQEAEEKGARLMKTKEKAAEGQTGTEEGQGGTEERAKESRGAKRESEGGQEGTEASGKGPKRRGGMPKGRYEGLVSW
eukprot:CAMPEP_0184643714 /NCGR_PEP_ID=MMETSP0308-20130426/539_1 /TAXON_ID=38269 /ORGANISM="Gloeochaete witrockiana, Strain SAG 46.84" /LENGTH=188 /DNA_ID=CAMNT_0027071825 /DNA_START=48 /DNA_END=615 /DNA_ORIENTATION=+